MNVQRDIGASGIPRWRVYRDARELLVLANLAVELSSDTGRTDVPRALATLDRMRAILGAGDGQ